MKNFAEKKAPVSSSIARGTVTRDPEMAKPAGKTDKLPETSKPSSSDKAMLDDLSKNPTVSLPEIDAPNTPTEMTKSRIPPRVDTPFSISASDKGVTLSVENQSTTNGTVLINGQSSFKLAKGDNAINLTGVNQTSPGNADKLKLVAKKGNTLLKESNNFSVAAIPQNWTIDAANITNSDSNGKVGIMVPFSFQSDSNDIKDLDEVSVNEQVQVKEKTGIYEKAQINNSVSLTYQPIKNPNKPDDFSTSGVDAHRTSKNVYADGGKVVFDQLHIFKDTRTGVSEIHIPNSGFKLTYDMSKIANPVYFDYQLIVSKNGEKTDVNGFSAEAGIGSYTSPDPIKFRSTH